MTRDILVTGGLGYVGGRIARHLATVDGLSLRLTSRTPPALAPSWLVQGRLVAWDSGDTDLTALLAGVDTVVHCAALNEIDSARDPLAALQVNGVDSVRLLLAAQQAGVRRFIYFSTAHVYGAPLAGVIDERTLTRPVHPYAISHKVTEDFVLAQHDQKKIDGVVVRLSNGFGAPIAADVNRWTLIANDLCRQAVSARKLVLKSSGLQRRDFVTLDDVAACVAHLIDLPSDGLQDGLFNLGGKHAMSMLELAEFIAIRCEAVLGFRPALERPAPLPGETAPELRYVVDKLESTGFVLRGGMSDEIDATLRLCQGAFGAAA
ncbi:NAD-dependent epimerase/dehydratase family protein [Massilia sp. TWP1-3-3]|uniref:NAD-dependent epimerase/dehydratase family protein n=1 Tax=Massilia sp. TWP1-3-3 TaxID=2804573 RepID=UPI003CF4C2D3